MEQVEILEMPNHRSNPPQQHIQPPPLQSVWEQSPVENHSSTDDQRENLQHFAPPPSPPVVITTEETVENEGVEEEDVEEEQTQGAGTSPPPPPPQYTTPDQAFDLPVDEDEDAATLNGLGDKEDRESGAVWRITPPNPILYELNEINKLVKILGTWSRQIHSFCRWRTRTRMLFLQMKV